MKKFFREFKEFINKGNIVDLAVAVIVGGAFGKIVTSMVNDIIMPLLGAIIGRQSFSDLKIVIKQATATTTELAINYGNFLQTLIDFLIICFFMFLAIKVLMASKKTLEQATDKLAEGFQKLTKKDKKMLKKHGVDIKNLEKSARNADIKNKFDGQKPTAASPDNPEVKQTNEYLKEIITLLKEKK